MQARYIGGGKVDNTYTIENIDDNTRGAVVYVDISTGYFFDINKSDMKLSAGINNVFDKNPPIMGNTFPGWPPTSLALYDVVGRYFYMGLKYDF